MKDIIFNRNDYLSFKDFYIDLFKKLKGSTIPDWKDLPTLDYNANNLNEFLWYCHDDNNKYIFKNFDLEIIKNYKNHENYEWSIIIKVFEDFVKEYPNNMLEFINEN